MISLAVCVLTGLLGIADGLRDNPGDLLVCYPGDTVKELSVSIFADSFWEETQRLELSSGEDSLYILVFQWPGNGACLTVFHRDGEDYRMTGEYTSLFGGNGIDFVVSNPVFNSLNELEFRLDLTGHLRGYYPDPGNSDTYVEPAEYKSGIVFATGDDSLRVVSCSILSESEGRTPIKQTLLHPMDSFTAYTLDKNEWVLNFPLTPGWVMWGVTDDITVELDAECWLGGVPSVNARFSLADQNGMLPAMAFESMYQYLPHTVNLLEDYEYLNVRRSGSSWFNRVNLSWGLSNRINLHLSPGATYSERLEIDNGQRSPFLSVVDNDLFQGDISVGLDWRISDWLSAHTSVSEGVTFVYLDNVPGKRQVASGVRVAPFVRMSQPILRNLGVELAVLSISFPDIDETLTGPMFYLYWQWNSN